MSDTEQVNQQPFSGKTLRWAVTIIVASFLLSLLLLIFSAPPTTARSFDPNSYSTSAIGHAALVEMLEDLDQRVLVSGFRSGRRASRGALLVVNEPDAYREEDLTAVLDEAATVLVVLPKWFGLPDAENPAWLGSAVLASESWIRSVVGVMQVAGDFQRLARPASSLRWDLGPLLTPPTIDQPVQLLDPASMHPVIACDEGILLGWITRNEEKLFILTDPDILSNHGLTKGENAVLAMEIFNHLREDPDDVIVFDETLHGYGGEPGIWREMMAFPLVLALSQAFLATLVLLWAGMTRFGAPKSPPPAVEPGKDFLIENTAELIRSSGHSSFSAERYFAATVRDVAERLHAPEGLDQRALVKWLSQHGERKGLRLDIAFLRSEVSALSGKDRSAKGHENRVVKAARRLHRWRQEILHGPESHQGRH